MRSKEVMDPLLSVIIPVYNVEKYLKRCIESILIQEWKNFDILLVDDGSTDHSPQICDDYARRYSFVSVIHKENGGLSEARNTGLSYAKGEYVYFPDSDDWIEPNTFIEISDEIESCIYDIISFDREFVTGEDNIIKQPPLKIQKLTGKDAFIEMLNHGYITGFANDKLYRRTLFKDNKIEFPLRKYYEDLGTNYKLFLSAKQVFSTNQKYYHYLVTNPDSITNSWSEKKLRDMFRFYKEIFYSDFVRSELNEDEIRISQMYYVNGLIHILSSLYKSDLFEKHPSIEIEVQKELQKNKVELLGMKQQPNFLKYLLFRLDILKIAFRLQKIIKK